MHKNKLAFVKIQIDPYLEDAKCFKCNNRSFFFCRNEYCLDYYCENCWKTNHDMISNGEHQSLSRQNKPNHGWEKMWFYFSCFFSFFKKSFIMFEFWLSEWGNSINWPRNSSSFFYPIFDTFKLINLMKSSINLKIVIRKISFLKNLIQTFLSTHLKCVICLL